jgi:hypothetical protein
MDFSKRMLLTAKKHAKNNQDEVMSSDECGCFHCLETFSKDAIVDWSEEEDGTTAVCPFCDVDAVIGDAAGYPLTEDFLNAMREEVYA